MRKTVLIVTLFVLPLIVIYINLQNESTQQFKLTKLKEQVADKHKPGVDHSKLPELQKTFARPQDVTLACIACHTERHTEVMNTSHWQWKREEYIEGRGITATGKRNIINNHCISINGSEGTCNKCHIGYGYDDKNFDFTAAENVDCLACHANSGTYKKGKEMAGYPAPTVDLATEVKTIGLPKMDNCGKCHFDGGGGNNAKHGDLEQALLKTSRDVDVHMGKNGANMECVECHTAENHQMKGKLYTVSSMNRDRMECEQCHTSKPHESDIVNEHTVKVACQTCHIPTYAKVNSTKTHWDWSKAGDLRNGKPYVTKDSLGNETYQSIKGKIDWGRNLTPEYKWFNGTADHYLLTDTATVFPIVLNPFKGDYQDPDAKIYPVKVMRSVQPYDPVNKRLLSPKLWDKEVGKGAYWKDFNWVTSLKAGMEYLNLPYSGQYTFEKTESNWIVNHMVSPKENSLKCESCHQQTNSQIASITDVYLPGRDRNPFVETMGVGMVVMSLIGFGGHGVVRIYFKSKEKKLRRK